MRSSKTKETGRGLEEEPSKEQSAIAAILALSPLLVYGVISLLGSYYKDHPTVNPRPTTQYYYEAKKPNIVYKEPSCKSLTHPYTNPDGVTLNLNGIIVHTPISSEDILQQLSLDYQDILDYNGGPEELY